MTFTSPAFAFNSLYEIQIFYQILLAYGTTLSILFMRFLILLFRRIRAGNLSILFMRFVWKPEHIRLSVSYLSILFMRFSWCFHRSDKLPMVKLSILFMRFQKQQDVMIKNFIATFQFSLWDSFRTNNNFVWIYYRLSILFMRFGKQALAKARTKGAFNSLYEILNNNLPNI